MNRIVLALGMFDGVHRGHRALLERAASIAKENGDRAVVFTYTNHPKELLGGQVEYLSTLSQKRAICRSLGMETVDAVPFTEPFRQQSPKDFLAWLLERYDGAISTVLCGYDYRFGRNAAGDAALLRSLGDAFGFSTVVLEPVEFGGAPCSSTRVRKALKDGEIDLANALLLRPYALTGTVVHNRAIGRTIGFPTANLDTGALLLPKDGVYATALIAEDTAYAAVTNVGTNPTVNGTRRTVETYAMDRTLSLYGETATVLLLGRLRDEIRFPSTDALKEQIALDAEAAKKVFKENEKSVYNARAVW